MYIIYMIIKSSASANFREILFKHLIRFGNEHKNQLVNAFRNSCGFDKQNSMNNTHVYTWFSSDENDYYYEYDHLSNVTLTVHTSQFVRWSFIHFSCWSIHGLYKYHVCIHYTYSDRVFWHRFFNKWVGFMMIPFSG